MLLHTTYEASDPLRKAQKTICSASVSLDHRRDLPLTASCGALRSNRYRSVPAVCGDCAQASTQIRHVVLATFLLQTHELSILGSMRLQGFREVSSYTCSGTFVTLSGAQGRHTGPHAAPVLHCFIPGAASRVCARGCRHR